MKVISTAVITLALLGFNHQTSFAAEYPPNRDYGDQGDFIAKRATANGRAAIIMPIGPVIVTQPERPGSSSHGIEGGRDLKNGYWDLSDLTNPTLIEPIWCSQNPDIDCTHSMPIGAHGTVVRIDDDANETYLYEPAHFSARWTTFDPSGSTSEQQMKKGSFDVTDNGRIGTYSSLTSPYSLPQYWSYGAAPTLEFADGSSTGDYYVRDSRFPDENLKTSSAATGILLTEWDHLGLTGVSGFPIWLGHYLIYASDQAQTGIAIYDMSGYKQGAKPKLLSTYDPPINKPEPNNGLEEGIGGYWMEAYGTNKIIFSARKISSPRSREFASLFIVDIDDPLNPKLSCELYFDQDSTTSADGDTSSDPMYVHFQDGYAYADHFKIDIAACEAAYAGDNRVVQSNDPTVDEFFDVVYRFNDVGNSCDGSQYFRPLGQVGVFGGYDWFQTTYVIEYTGPELPLQPNPVVNNNRAKTSNDVYANYGINPNTGNYRSSWRSADIAVNDVLTHDGIDRTVVSVTQDESSNEQGLCFMVSSDEADTNPPFISGHLPKDGATNVPVDTFISIHIPETLRSESLVDAFIVTNTSTNEIIPSRKQLSHTGAISIWPDSDLAANTTFTVDVVGVQDFMGNTMSNQRFSFSTGNEVVETPVVVDNDTAPTFGSEDFPGTPYFPNQSSQLSCQNESLDNNIWTVNPDNHTITVIDTTLDSSFELGAGEPQEIFVNYRTPTSITHVGTHYAVTFRDDDQVVFFNTVTAEPEFSFNTGYGSQPISSLADADNAFLYVALYGSGEIIKLDLSTAVQNNIQMVDSVAVGSTPKAMSLLGERLLVTRYISAQDHGEVYDIDTSSMELTRTIRVNKVTVADDIIHGSGVPNFLGSIVISPDGTKAYVTAIKANTDNAALDDDNTVRPMMAILDLTTGTDINDGDTANANKTIDFDNAADPSGVIILPDGNTRITALQGNNRITAEKIDDRHAPVSITTGGAPQSMCTTERITYVKNYTSRTITAIDTSAYMHTGRINPAIITLNTVDANTELLGEEELKGLQIFYHSSQPEMGDEGYISCASCHQDGGQDGRTWNLVGLGEGMRNTIGLNGTSGTRFGRLHWSQNFDEVQDFELQMEKLNRGDGLIAGITFRNNQSPLDEITSGRSTDLDALAAYVSSLGKESVKRSPHRDPVSGALTLNAEEGQRVFNDLGCADCHSGTAFRDGLGHDVGTIDPNDNQAYGQTGALTQVRTPTLIDLFETAPYFHNGSAATLEEVFAAGAEHAVPVEDQADLIEFLYSIDQSMFIDDNETFIPSTP